jgi:predicted dehydrogenase
MTPLRIGVLGAARIVPMALTRPALEVPGVKISAIAARDVKRAEAFARKHGIPEFLGSYEELVNSPDVDAVYVPLPNSLHCEWTLRALEAGKHVLCEKPIASNAAEAQRMTDAAKLSGRVLMEAFHWRYHPLADRMIEILRSGKLGRLQSIDATLAFPLLSRGDIRYQLALSGGAMMDAGCYTVSWVRHLMGAELDVVSAEARLASTSVDRYMSAQLQFPDGVTGSVTASFFSTTILKMSIVVKGELGELRVTNPILPHFWHRLVLSTKEGKTVERVPGTATYVYQLRAFEQAVREGTAFPTHGDDAVANMRVIDAVYRKAGLPLRGAA